ncbi:MAG: 7-carboxy-7-deazaguanine synthase QueE [Thermoanaerobaculia bacterium]|nr:7-carboxy-7-deazaguanine synthase QueE [Thermoanaerobaculia bacterium]
MSEVRLKIYEIFYSIQGESTFAGRPCVLVRLTGCQMRCSWCDTEYAFHGGAWMGLDEVMEKVAAFGCPLVEVTGGEPLLQPGCLPLLTALCDAGYEVLLETGGGLEIAPVDPRVRRILDIKCPASGESTNNRWENLADLRATDEIKFVVADRGDYDWAKGVIADRSLAGVCPIHFSPVWETCPPAELAAWILADRLPVRLTLQQHKILWGKDTRGV